MRFWTFSQIKGRLLEDNFPDKSGSKPYFRTTSQFPVISKLMESTWISQNDGRLIVIYTTGSIGSPMRDPPLIFLLLLPTGVHDKYMSCQLSIHKATLQSYTEQQPQYNVYACIKVSWSNSGWGTLYSSMHLTLCHVHYPIKIFERLFSCHSFLNATCTPVNLKHVAPEICPIFYNAIRNPSGYMI